MANHLYTWINPVRESHIDQICKVLDGDGVIALPLDVAWGFVCDASSPKAVEKIRKLKPYHPKDRPFSLVCSSISMAAHICTIDDQAYRWLKKSMPGPFTLILARHGSLGKQINDNRREVGLRIPKDPLAQAVIEKLGRPLVTSTIPLEQTPIILEDQTLYPGHDLPSFGSQVMDVWGHAIDLIADLGDECPRLETTIIDLTQGAPKLIREGAGDISLFGL